MIYGTGPENVFSYSTVYSRTGFLGESNTAPLLGRVLRHNPIGLNLADGFSKFSQRAKVDWRKWKRKIRSSSPLRHFPQLCN